MTVKCRYEKGRKLNYILQQLFWLKPKITHDYTHACIANHPTFRTAFAYLVRSKKIPRMNFMKIYYKRVKNVLPSSYYFGLLTASNYFHSCYENLFFFLILIQSAIHSGFNLYFNFQIKCSVMCISKYKYRNEEITHNKLYPGNSVGAVP